MGVSMYLIKHIFQSHPKFSSSIVALVVCSLALFRYLHLLLVAWSFVIGVAVTYCVLSPDALVPNLLFMHWRKRKLSQAEDDLSLRKVICAVCGKRKCPRHRPELNILAFQPWTNLEIAEKVDQAMEEFLNIVFKDFVYTWYKEISNEEEFVEELRSSIRFIVAVLLRRAKKIDIPNMITTKLMKAGLQHLDCYLRARHSASPGSDVQQATLEQYGHHLHAAMKNRKTEQEYLRRLAERLFPYILKPQSLRCRSLCGLVREIITGSILLPSLDAIANPDMVNNMVLIFLDETPSPVSTEPPSPRVTILSHFSQPVCKNNSCLKLEISDVMNRNNSQVLYAFMQFLKSEAAINVLQFCLQCEDFNNKILNPELSQGELIELHQMATELYRNYCAPDALDRIKFDDSIVSELAGVVHGPRDQVLRLRTTVCLYRAYEHAFDLLENTFLPLFHQSDDYYAMVCGSRTPSSLSRAASKQLKKEKSGLSNFGNKLKEVFRVNSADSLDKMDDFDTRTIASTSSLEEESSDSALYEDGAEDSPVRDLSTWRVTIPRIGARPDLDNMKKQYFVFIIDVRRIDTRDDDLTRKNNWVVARRYNEFYVLDQKLKEFHAGDLIDCTLPPKKTFGTKNQYFMEEKRDALELYLQKLLYKPILKGSELLHNFLASERDFTASFLPDIKLGKMFRSVPLKLVKEKGQHLDPFLQSLLQSTEAPKPRPSKSVERRGSDASYVSLKSTSSEKMCSGIFENNANISQDGCLSTSSRELPLVEVDGVVDILLYIARHVYGVSDWLHHVAITARILLKNTVESYLDCYIANKVEQVTQEHRIVGFIHLLRDVLFFDTDPPRTDEQKRERLEQTLKEAKDFIPTTISKVLDDEKVHDGTKLVIDLLQQSVLMELYTTISKVLDDEKVHDGTKLVIDLLQQPKLNKQLSYVFLDIFILELFPELQQSPVQDDQSDS